MPDVIYTCLICHKPVPDYKPEYCCNGQDCGCGGQPIEPCVCCPACTTALMAGIGKTFEQRRIDAGINLDPQVVADIERLKTWILTLGVGEAGEFTPEIDAAMMRLWVDRTNPANELHRKIVYIFEAVLQYRIEADKFSPYYFEKQERLKHLWNEIAKRAASLTP